MAGIACGAIKRAKRYLEKKGYKFIGGLEIGVPTYDSVIWFDYFKNVSWKLDKIKRAYYFGKNIGTILEKGKGIIKEYRVIPLGIILSNFLAYIERPMYRILISVLYHNKNYCTKCKTCEKICPVNAIDVENGKFFDKSKCILCFKCGRYCPNKAIRFRLFYNAEFFKGPFQIKGYIPPNEIPSKF